MKNILYLYIEIDGYYCLQGVQITDTIKELSNEPQ